MIEYPALKIAAEEMAAELETVLDYWTTNTIDNEFGGFVGQIDHFGNANNKAVKGAVLNARLLWTYSAAYRKVGSEKLEQMATRAYSYLVDHFVDKENGGVFWALNYKGEVLNTRKQAYAQGFAVYAFSEYYLATGNKESLEHAINIYRLMESKFRDTQQGGYIEALANDWLPLEDMRLSEKDANLPKSMNTHLHILEPYTNLYRAWPNLALKESILHLLDVFQNKIIKHETGHFTLFFDMDWERKGNILSFGHDIEGAWLLREAALEINDEQVIESIEKPALKLVDITLKEGCDSDGSVFYEFENGHLDTDKHWWAQAEAMVGLMDAWEISGDKRYLKEIEQIWRFIKENFIDYENGEWYSRLDKNNVPIEGDDKAGFWKCPYHNSRALIEMVKRIDKHIN